MLSINVPSEAQLPDHPLPLNIDPQAASSCLRFSVAQTMKKIFIKEVCSV